MENKKNQFAVVCVIGQPGSGKDALANYLVEKKTFCHISTGDIIREEMKKKNIPTDRESMRFFSAKKRKEVGNNYPADIALGKIAGDTVVSGPRNFAEVKVFKSKFGKNFILVAVSAPVEVRYERVKNGRSREGDNITLGEFRKQERAEYSSGTHDLNRLLSVADFVIDNSGTKEEMFAKMDNILDSTK